MQTAKRRPSPRVLRETRQTRMSLSPYLVEETTFTLEEIRKAREAA